ncbi:ABC transporter ATP-binding protein [Oceanobacillus indicireducens]|nr:ABC transporter ATP-binding protein [Oceanobacillus indicireducens]
MMSILSVTGLRKEYKNMTAVRGVDFSLPEGKCIALIGPNGAGKTTILRILAGLLKQTDGAVTFSGKETNADIRKFIGYLPQYPVFPSWMTAREFLLFSGEIAGLTKEEAARRAEDLAEQVGITNALDKRISDFSGGMKQRLGIAQAIIHSPQLLLLDEPVSSLDPIGRRDVLTLLERLKKEMTILFSTHILNDAEEVCDELLLLHDGEINEAGSMEALREKYQTSVIEVEFQENRQRYLEKLKQLPGITACTLERQIIKIPVADIAQARKEIFQAAAEENWPIIGFNLNRASLEDLFMKAVKK